MLSKLKKGEKVLVINGKPFPHGYSIGDVIRIDRLSDTKNRYCAEKNGYSQYINRDQLLAIGDKVVRGPDWFKGYSGPGDFAGVGEVTEIRPGYVNATDSEGKRWSPRMTADHQDLKPTGDSEGTGEDKPGCFGSEDCPKQHTCDCWTECREAIELYNEQKHKPTVHKITVTIQEDTMTREQRAVKKDEEVKGLEDAIADAKIAHKEDIAAKEEVIASLKADAKNLRDYKTDKAENIALVRTAKGCTTKQAEAMLALKDKGIEV